MTVQDDEQLAAQAIEAGAYEDAVRLLQPLVEHNSEYALLTLGWIYEVGATGTPDEGAAQVYYEHAAARGSAVAHLYLGGLLLSKGEEAQARAAFEAGFQLGNDECRSALQRLDNNRVEQLAAEAVEKGDYKEAARLVQPLVEGNSEYALLTLGWIYETGGMGDPDTDTAQVYYERAAAIGSASACLYLGRLLLGKGEEMRARDAFEAGAQLGDDECESALRKLDNNGVERLAEQAIGRGQYDEALRLLQPLAERNSEYALLALGYIYETGAPGTSDKDLARSYYERAAVEGSAAAYFDLGRLHLAEGEEAQARSAFEAGAERGDIACMSRLGRMMVDGRGGPPDIVGGSAWLEKAAAQGHIFSQRALLSLELRNAKSIFGRLSARMKIISLASKGAKEMLKDPNSDKLR